jgi:hypothetical protein
MESSPPGASRSSWGTTVAEPRYAGGEIHSPARSCSRRPTYLHGNGMMTAWSPVFLNRQLSRSSVAGSSNTEGGAAARCFQPTGSAIEAGCVDEQPDTSSQQRRTHDEAPRLSFVRFWCVFKESDYHSRHTRSGGEKLRSSSARNAPTRAVLPARRAMRASAIRRASWHTRLSMNRRRSKRMTVPCVACGG